MQSMLALVLPKVLPVFLLIVLGIIIRQKSILSAATIDELKKIIINIVLPCVLYFSFVNITLYWSLILLVVVMFLLCVVMLFFGFALKSVNLVQSGYFPFLFTGFEFGMMGASLFGAVFGLDKVGYIGIVGLGHELFIWFVFVTLLTIKRDGKSNLSATLVSFVKSPVIIAIVLGIIFNVTGIANVISRYWPIQSLYNAMHFVEQLIVPLILIVVGYGLNIREIKLSNAMIVVVIRFGLLIPIALMINRWIIRTYLQLDPLYEAAVFIFFILPPPFIIPLFISQQKKQEQSLINGVLIVYSLFTFVAFSLYYAYYVTTAS